MSLGWPACLDEIAVGKAGLVEFREAGTLVLEESSHNLLVN